MSAYIEPLVKMVKSNQGKVLAITAVLASIAIGYSFLKKNPSKKKVFNTCFKLAVQMSLFCCNTIVIIDITLTIPVEKLI